MRCPRCEQENDLDALRCVHCGGSTAVATLELLRGSLPEKVHFLAPRSYTLGRGAHNDILLEEPSISKAHARLRHEEGRFVIEDAGSLHGVYVDTVKAKRAELRPGAEIQLGNTTFRFSPLKAEGSTDRIADLPWVEHQQLLLSLVQSLNSTLVLSSVLEQVLAGVMGITRAERGFLLLTDGPEDSLRHPSVAGLRLMLGRACDGVAITEPAGISSSVVRKAMETGETVATGNAVADPDLGLATSVILMDLRTVVCIPLLSPRRTADAVPAARAVGALYVDNPRTSTSFPPDSLRTAEALAHHAALAIENAQLFERGQRTIEELRIAQRKLLQSEKLATIGQMAAGIAHELNTPLTYILGNLELLQNQPFSADQREMLESVSKGAERIRTLARSLLAFSRPSQEEPIPLAVNELVERALDLCRYQILKAGISLEKDLAFGLAPVLGVSNQLEMALINLIVNAAQALDGRDTRVLRLATEAGDEVVRIRVSDTGPGIPAPLRASVFEPFVTTKSEGHGTGLGLSTVLMVVERHGGRIEMETASANGTTFTVTLPASRQPPAAPGPGRRD
jgi:signal transduction histidine kinase